MSDASPKRWFSLHSVAERAVRQRFRWAGLESRVLDLGLARVHFWIGGNGPPLLLLHGFGGDATWGWHPQVAPLARRHTLIVPDLVWFGRSAASTEERSLYFQAEVQAALCQALGVERFDVCGVSYGGLVAFTMAAMYHDRVRRLVLVDSPGPVYDDRDHHHILDHFGVTDVSQLIIASEPRDVRRLLELAWRKPPPTPGFVLEDTFDRVFSIHVEQKRQLLAWLDHQRADPALRPEWTVPQRTMLIWGAEDPLFPVSLAERLAAELAAEELFVIPETRHAPNLERPDLFNDKLMHFLRR